MEELSCVQRATAPTLALWPSAVSYSESIEFELYIHIPVYPGKSYLNFSQFLPEAVGTAAGIVSGLSISKFVSVFLEITLPNNVRFCNLCRCYNVVKQKY